MDFEIADWHEKISALTNHFTHHKNVYSSAVLAAVIGFLLFKTYQFIKSFFPVSVNCWFCNSDHKVPAESQNSWYCNNCQQYNGFAEDGSYNRVIPEQYYECLNPDYADKSLKKSAPASNGLCKSCNVNLELKRVQLASFEPLDPNNYDWEVEEYSKFLEKNYKLCSYCEGVVSNTLEHQLKLLNIGQLVTKAGHKLANSSVRFLNHQSNPVDLQQLLKNTKTCLWLSSVFCVRFFAEMYFKPSFTSVFSAPFESLLSNYWNIPTLGYFFPIVQLVLDNGSNWSGFALIATSLVQTLRQCRNRVFVDYLITFGWILLFLIETAFIFSGVNQKKNSAQVLILTLIFTFSLWKLIYFKYFYPKSCKKLQSKFKVIPSSKSYKTEEQSPISVINKEPIQPQQQKKQSQKYVGTKILDSDLGIGSLNLGPTQAPPTSCKNVFSLSNDSFPTKRKPLILPPRLNFNLKNELNEINFPPSRPPSQSSGYETMNKSGYDSNNSSLIGDEDYDVPLKSSSPLQLANYTNFVPPVLPPQNLSPYELYSYYHFSAKFQASYGPQSTHNLSTCSSCANSPVNVNSNKWFLVIFMGFLFLVLQQFFILYSLFYR